MDSVRLDIRMLQTMVLIQHFFSIRIASYYSIKHSQRLHVPFGWNEHSRMTLCLCQETSYQYTLLHSLQMVGKPLWNRHVETLLDAQHFAIFLCNFAPSPGTNRVIVEIVFLPSMSKTMLVQYDMATKVLIYPWKGSNLPLDQPLNSQMFCKMSFWIEYFHISNHIIHI